MSILSKYVATATLANRKQSYECECLEFASLMQQNSEIVEPQQKSAQPFSLNRLDEKRTLFAFITLAPLSQAIRSGLAAISQ